MTALQDQLDEITANTRNLVQAERMAIGERAVEELFASGIEEKNPSRRRHGSRVHPQRRLRPPGPLRRPARPRPARLNFFRGRWCPYCVTELEAWRDLYPRLREAGALLAAISPQTTPPE